MDTHTIIVLTLIGLFAGGFGGLLGIGGSIIFIPAATILIKPDQQVYQAAAMILNVFVAGTAALKHYRKGAIDHKVIIRIAPFAVTMVIIGVLVSNAVNGLVLLRIFGVLAWLIAINEFRILLRGKPEETTPAQEPSPRTSLPYMGGIGSAMGFLGGLLGIGGGVIAVPLLQFIARFPIRMSITTAACVTFPMALFGAILKNATLHQLTNQDGQSLSAWDSFGIAAALVPTAIIGSWLGATFLHRLPIPAIRAAFACLLLFAGFRMTGVI